MISIFELVFDLDEDKEENQVCCPFLHTDTSGHTYYEDNPSAGINLEKNVFHCLSCGRGYNELGFTKEYFGITKDTLAQQFLDMMHKPHETLQFYEQNRELYYSIPRPAVEKVKQSLGFTDECIEKLHLTIGGKSKADIDFPLFLLGLKVDNTNYERGRVPKSIRSKHSISGLINPYDSWVYTDPKRVTLICAGEKDLACAISNGFNAISISGGERALPLFTNCFINRTLVICYDNDTAGKQGAEHLANFLYTYTQNIRILDLSPVCVEPKEDLWDFFNKYNKTADDLKQLISNTPIFDKANIVIQEDPPILLSESLQPYYINKSVNSNVQVVAEISTKFSIPSSIEILKGEENDGGTLVKGTRKYWELDETNLKDILYLMDNNLKETQIRKNILTKLFKLPDKEANVYINYKKYSTIYQSTVTDCFETVDTDNTVTELVAYSINKSLESGKKYNIKFIITPNPYEGNKTTMIIYDAKDAQDSLDSFDLTPEKITLLKQFQVTTTLQDKMHELTERCKGIVHANYNPTLLNFIDLWYHTPLLFKVGNLDPIRATIDALLVAESRVGKSSTAEALKKMYGLGTIISFAGNATTEAGLIGGSNKVNGSFQTKAGIIPQMHKNAIIYEELGKANNNLLKTLTDVRSSSRVRITRISSSIELPAMVRTLALTNTKSNGLPKSIASYPNGIEILTDLVGTAEDIARYDMVCILADKGAEEIDPFFEPQMPLSKEAYQARIRWIWSRTADDIIISKGIYGYCVNKANTINKTFNSYIKIFGTEAWKKIMRLAIAIAGYTVSASEDYTKIIITQAHIDYAADFLINLYDNKTFRFKEYVEEELSYIRYDQDSINALQNLYNASPVLLNHLNNTSETNKSNICAVAGLTNDEASSRLSVLASFKFIKLYGFAIKPTERFRSCMEKIDKRVRIQQVGEMNIHL